MAILAGLTLIIGVYPQPLLNPLTEYIQGMFEGDKTVLPLPAPVHAGGTNISMINSNANLTSTILQGGTN